ncbi:OmpA family protein [Endozoicomonas acroporae]|uniref:OmpA family protein n=1 Tax=Endozoicomonas acroporae TaxID=1701104 RepID=UPI003D799950
MPFITPLKTLTLFIITLFLTGCASDGHLHNRKLALRRAESVKQYLEERGVSGNRIKAVAGGVLESGDQTREGRRNNRHVTISIEG